MLRSRGIDLDAYLALSFPKNELFEPWQLVTHMFMHANEMHILFNMLALWMFGSAVEGILGTKRFLILYFIAGIGAFSLHLGYDYFQYQVLIDNVVSSGISYERLNDILTFEGTIENTKQLLDKLNSSLTQQEINLINEKGIGDSLIESAIIYNSNMLGASGAIMGILAAFGMLLPNAELMLIFLPIPIKAKYFIPGIILLDVFSFFTGVSIFSPSNTAFLAHIGGAITGFIVMMLWKKRNKTYYY